MSAPQSAQQLPDGEFTHVAIAALTFSKSAAQAERRKHFDPKQLEELATDIKVKGILQPIVVRPIDGKNGAEAFEVVAGERRSIGAKQAGLVLIPAMVRKLTDDQALDVQLVENLQREGLHELVECEGFEDLKARGFTVEQIAEKVGRSISYVYKRLELVACGSEVRKAFYEAKIDASKALLLSRLKGADQAKALKEILDTWDGEPMSFRQAVDWVNRNYLLRLDNAPFSPDDEKLVPAAGACGKCAKNTASQKDLFGNVSKEAGRCTDSKCFQEKTVAAAAIKVKVAQQQNRPVFQGKEARKALGKHGDGAGNFIAPGRMVEGDQQYRTYEKLLGKDLAKVTAVAVDPDTKKVVELVDKAAASQLIKEKGIKLTRPTVTRSAPKESEKQKAERLAKEASDKLQIAIGKAIYAKPPKPFTTEELQKIAECVDQNAYDAAEAIEGMTGLASAPRFEKLNDAALVRYIRALLLAEHVEEGDKGVLAAAAKRHGVDVKKIEAELAPKPAAATTAKSKKKAAKKK